jgi:hypothetical protein
MSHLPFARNVIVGVLLLLVLGVPILETWRALLLAVGVLAVIFSVREPRWRRLVAAAAVVLAVVAVKALLPIADIAEGHNTFLVHHDGDVLQEGLPAEIFASWSTQFDALYPDDGRPGAFDRSNNGEFPKSLYTWSSDAIWRSAKYTRQVDGIQFRSLAEFRGGFAGELRYNYYSGMLRRETMPFYVMYELSPASAGSSLAWKGQVFWEQANSEFAEIFHPEVARRMIVPEDAGRRVYAVFFPTPGPLSNLVPEYEHYFKMELSPRLRLSAWTNVLVTIVGWISVLALTVRVKGRALTGALAIFSAGYLFIASFISVSLGKFLGKDYTPLGGGDDGIVYESYGRVGAMLVGRGEFLEALMGVEPVYWFQPGMRYFRMVEKLFFGDTYLLYALVVACLPILVFYLVRHFAASYVAWCAVAVFYVSLVGNLSFLQHVRIAKLGYAEPLAVGLFLLGLTLLLRTEPRWGGADRNPPMVWVAGVALALAIFLRPNFLLAVVWLGAAHAWASCRRRDFVSTAALLLGLAVTAGMPLHNWYYGGEYVLITGSGMELALHFGIGDYLQAAGDLFRGQFGEGSSLFLVSQQLRAWLFDVGPVVPVELIPIARALHVVKLAALVLTGWLALRFLAGGSVKPKGLGVVAVAAGGAFATLLVSTYTVYRYAILGWDLCLVVLIVWLAQSERLKRVVNRYRQPFNESVTPMTRLSKRLPMTNDSA